MPLSDGVLSVIKEVLQSCNDNSAETLYLFCFSLCRNVIQIKLIEDSVVTPWTCLLHKSICSLTVCDA